MKTYRVTVQQDSIVRQFVLKSSRAGIAADRGLSNMVGRAMRTGESVTMTITAIATPPKAAVRK